MIRRLSGQPRALLWLAGATTLLVLAMYLFAPAARQATPELAPLALDVVPVNRLEQRIGVQAWGQAQPAREIPMLAEVSGVIEHTSEQFVSGAAVTIDTALVTLADEDYQLALAQRENDVSAARLHLEEVRARARVARKVNGSNASPYALLTPHLAEAETRLAAAEAARRQAELQLARTRVHAPFPGRLRTVLVRQGQLVSAGQVLGQLYAPERIEVRLPVRDHWLGLLAEQAPDGVLESPIPVRFEARYGGLQQHWQGQVVRVEGGLDRNQMVTLVAQISDQDGQSPPPPGVWLKASVQSRPLTAVARLPSSVLGHDGAVWVVDGQQRLQRRPVDVLYHDDQSVFVGDGLRDGELVALSGSLRLLEGAPVNPRRAWMKAGSLGALTP